MKEVQFLLNNRDKWKKIENLIEEPKLVDSDDLAELYQDIMDSLSYANTFYPGSKTALYLNSLSIRIHSQVYKNKKEGAGKFKKFWLHDVPMEFYNIRKNLLISLIIFVTGALIGIVSTANDDSFVRLILGDGYVNMTLDNIEKGDPMAVYKQQGEVEMFMAITFNNVRVSFLAFSFGLIFSLGAGYIVLKNAIMIGSFQFFFAEYGLLLESFKTVWIHGTIEISSIIIAGAAGITLGNSFLFPGSYPRLESFKRGALSGLKVVIGLVPLFIFAGFLEGFVTRHTEMPLALSFLIIGASAAFIFTYVVVYPYKLAKKGGAK